mmetsp:Transcript_68419/g.196287  ORF Transcript_68419/g.196287 Transcript_68419/m.196287 type:complete len:328 (-) Transcript_68419:206-1189(-)
MQRREGVQRGTQRHAHGAITFEMRHVLGIRDAHEGLAVEGGSGRLGLGDELLQNHLLGISASVQLVQHLHRVSPESLVAHGFAVGVQLLSEQSRELFANRRLVCPLANVQHSDLLVQLDQLRLLDGAIAIQVLCLEERLKQLLKSRLWPRAWHVWHGLRRPREITTLAGDAARPGACDVLQERGLPQPHDRRRVALDRRIWHLLRRLPQRLERVREEQGAVAELSPHRRVRVEGGLLLPVPRVVPQRGHDGLVGGDGAAHVLLHPDGLARGLAALVEQRLRGHGDLGACLGDLQAGLRVALRDLQACHRLLLEPLREHLGWCPVSLI